ncbi:MAG: hypothetical protein SPL30_05410 [Succinivibrio sp.]|nr:hypothetical protein [Succinivibrio sp.]
MDRLTLSCGSETLKTAEAAVKVPVNGLRQKDKPKDQAKRNGRVKERVRE